MLFRMFLRGSGCVFRCMHEPYDAKKWGRMDGKWLDIYIVGSSGGPLSLSGSAWQWASFTHASLRSQCLSLALTRSTEVPCLKTSCTMLACYYFIMASSSCFPAAPPIYPGLFFIFCLFLKGCASSFLRTCVLTLPQMIKPNFSCEIPPTVSPICGCIMREKGAGTETGGMSYSFFISLEFFFALFPHSALILFCFQAVLISPLASSKQVGHVWHNPLTCSQP